MQPLDLAQRGADDRDRRRAGDRGLGEFLLDVDDRPANAASTSVSSPSAEASATTAITSSISMRSWPCA
jgi:hypothetical protein